MYMVIVNHNGLVVIQLSNLIMLKQMQHTCFNNDTLHEL